MKAKIMENVEKLLKDYPELRNDDKELIWKYWRCCDIIVDGGGYSITRGRFIYSATNPAQIIRCRAKIQNIEGKYLPIDWKVAEKRKISREKWERELGYHKDNPNQMRMKGLV